MRCLIVAILLFVSFKVLADSCIPGDVFIQKKKTISVYTPTGSNDYCNGTGLECTNSKSYKQTIQWKSLDEVTDGNVLRIMLDKDGGIAPVGGLNGDVKYMGGRVCSYSKIDSGICKDKCLFVGYKTPTPDYDAGIYGLPCVMKGGVGVMIALECGSANLNASLETMRHLPPHTPVKRLHVLSAAEGGTEDDNTEDNPFRDSTTCQPITTIPKYCKIYAKAESKVYNHAAGEEKLTFLSGVVQSKHKFLEGIVDFFAKPMKQISKDLILNVSKHSYYKTFVASLFMLAIAIKAFKHGMFGSQNAGYEYFMLMVQISIVYLLLTPSGAQIFINMFIDPVFRFFEDTTKLAVRAVLHDAPYVQSNPTPISGDPGQVFRYMDESIFQKFSSGIQYKFKALISSDLTGILFIPLIGICIIVQIYGMFKAAIQFILAYFGIGLMVATVVILGPLSLIEIKPFKQAIQQLIPNISKLCIQSLSATVLVAGLVGISDVYIYKALGFRACEQTAMKVGIFSNSLTIFTLKGYLPGDHHDPYDFSITGVGDKFFGIFGRRDHLKLDPKSDLVKRRLPPSYRKIGYMYEDVPFLRPFDDSTGVKRDVEPVDQKTAIGSAIDQLNELLSEQRPYTVTKIANQILAKLNALSVSDSALILARDGAISAITTMRRIALEESGDSLGSDSKSKITSILSIAVRQLDVLQRAKLAKKSAAQGLFSPSASNPQSLIDIKASLFNALKTGTLSVTRGWYRDMFNKYAMDIGSQLMSEPIVGSGTFHKNSNANPNPLLKHLSSIIASRTLSDSACNVSLSKLKSDIASSALLTRERIPPLIRTEIYYDNGYTAPSGCSYAGASGKVFAPSRYKCTRQVPDYHYRSKPGASKEFAKLSGISKDVKSIANCIKKQYKADSSAKSDATTLDAIADQMSKMHRNFVDLKALIDAIDNNPRIVQGKTIYDQNCINRNLPDPNPPDGCTFTRSRNGMNEFKCCGSKDNVHNKIIDVLYNPLKGAIPEAKIEMNGIDKNFIEYLQNRSNPGVAIWLIIPYVGILSIILFTAEEAVSGVFSSISGAIGPGISGIAGRIFTLNSKGLGGALLSAVPKIRGQNIQQLSSQISSVPKMAIGKVTSLGVNPGKIVGKIGDSAKNKSGVLGDLAKATGSISKGMGAVSLIMPSHDNVAQMEKYGFGKIDKGLNYARVRLASARQHYDPANMAKDKIKGAVGGTLDGMKEWGDAHYKYDTKGLAKALGKSIYDSSGDTKDLNMFRTKGGHWKSTNEMKEIMKDRFFKGGISDELKDRFKSGDGGSLKDFIKQGVSDGMDEREKAYDALNAKLREDMLGKKHEHLAPEELVNSAVDQLKKEFDFDIIRSAGGEIIDKIQEYRHRNDDAMDDVVVHDPIPDIDFNSLPDIVDSNSLHEHIDATKQYMNDIHERMSHDVSQDERRELIDRLERTQQEIELIGRMDYVSDHKGELAPEMMDLHMIELQNDHHKIDLVQQMVQQDIDDLSRRMEDLDFNKNMALHDSRMDELKKVADELNVPMIGPMMPDQYTQDNEKIREEFREAQEMKADLQAQSDAIETEMQERMNRLNDVEEAARALDVQIMLLNQEMNQDSLGISRADDAEIDIADRMMLQDQAREERARSEHESMERQHREQDSRERVHMEQLERELQDRAHRRQEDEILDNERIRSSDMDSDLRESAMRDERDRAISSDAMASVNDMRDASSMTDHHLGNIFEHLSQDHVTFPVSSSIGDDIATASERVQLQEQQSQQMHDQQRQIVEREVQRLQQDMERARLIEDEHRRVEMEDQYRGDSTSEDSIRATHGARSSTPVADAFATLPDESAASATDHRDDLGGRDRSDPVSISDAAGQMLANAQTQADTITREIASLQNQLQAPGANTADLDIQIKNAQGKLAQIQGTISILMNMR